MGSLAGSKTYLIGMIDRSPDYGVSWRQEIIPHLESLSIKILDPTNKPSSNLSETQEDVIYRQTLVNQCRFEEVSKLMREIRSVDLRLTDICDFSITYVDLDIFMCGSWEEFFWCNRMKKPCLLIIKQGIKHTPQWLFGVVPHQHIFNQYTDLIKYLHKLDNNIELDQTGRWKIFDI